MMYRTTIVLAAAALIGGSVAQAEVIWWDYEFDGSSIPTAASPDWVQNGSPSGSVQTEGSDTFWHNVSTTDDVFDAYRVDPASPTWASNGADTTVEVRFRAWGDLNNGDTVTTDLGYEDAQIRVNQPREWPMRIENDGGGDILKFRQPTQSVHTAGSDWNIVRFLIDDAGSIDAYLLSGGALSGNGGAWTIADVTPVFSGWTGFVASGNNTLMIGGHIDVDYVRWSHDDLFAPEAIPEPSMASLLGLTAIATLGRRRER